MDQWTEYVRFATALFVVVNPIGAAPLFVGLASDRPERDRKRMVRAASLTTAAILAVSVLFGDSVLRFFGINVPCFQVGGGILLLLIAISMLHARPSRTQRTPEELRQAEDQDSVGVVPLGTPLLAGPGAISTAIIHAGKAETWGQEALMLVACLLVALAVWGILRLAGPISVFLGRTGINILTRLMGLILAAMAIKLMTDGIGQLLPGLAGRG